MSADAGALRPGSVIGPYQVSSQLGRGGMGEVYLATDTRLDRQVAIKAMPAHLAQDPDRLARFQREAKVLASLNHPGVGAIYGLEEVGGRQYLVLEYVGGETLADRLVRGPIPLDDALSIAKQIAESLEAAHEKGIVHRDLKPGNVMVTPEGVAKVLDFGLARTGEGSPSSTSIPASLADSPTITTPAARGKPVHSPTIPGVIMGSAGYMSPEQARGKPVDRRSDIFSFGCVLFEMLSGEQPFGGETTTDALGAILHREPEWNQLPPTTPPRVRELLVSCLAKDRRSRLHDIGDARLQIERAIAEPRDSSGSPLTVGAWWRSPRTIFVAASLLAGVSVASFVLTRSLLPAAVPHASRIARVSIALPEGSEVGSLGFGPYTISRDGTRVAYVESKDGKNRIVSRGFEELEPTPIEGTEGGDSPFFSPDGQWIGFFAGSKLRKVTVGGAAMQVLAEAPFHRGGFWGDDGFIYFAPTNITGIWRVAEGGGAPTQITKLSAEAGEISHRWPHLAAGTTSLLFSAWTGPGDDEHSIAVQNVGESKHHRLITGDAPHFASAPGMLLFTRLGQLFAVPWKPTQRDLGRSVPAATSEFVLNRARLEGAGNYALSDAGTLVFIRGKASIAERRVVWVDRQGAITPLPVPARTYLSSRLSPDNGRAVLEVLEGTVQCRIYDFARGTLTPLNTGPGSSQAPVWSADGTQIFFRGTRQGTRNMYRIAADGSGQEERLTNKPGVIQSPTSIASDGSLLLFNEEGPDEPDGSATWVLPLEGERTPRRLFPLPATAFNGQLSPDGKWVAYMARVSSRLEVFVSPFPGPGERRLVSTEGGTEPLWSADGRELFYQAGSALMSVTVEPGSTFAASPPKRVYEGRFIQSATGGTTFRVTSDGQRFLRIQPTEEAPVVDCIDVVFNWFTELEKRGAVRGTD